jgi:MFS family permease
MVLVLLSLEMMGNYYVYDFVGPLADLLSKQLGFSDKQIGMLQAIYSIPNILMVLVGGVLIDRIGVKKASLLFGAICCLGALLTAASPSFYVMAAGRLLFGLGAESLIVAVTTALAIWFKGKELGFAFGLNLTIARAGSYLAQTSTAWAPGAYESWRGPLLIALVFGAVCVLAPLAYYAVESSAKKRYTLAAQGSTDKVSWGDVLAFKTSYWWVVALCVTFYSAIFPFQTFAQKFFIDAHGATPQSAGLLVGNLTLFAMIGTPLFGLLVDKTASALFMMAGS